MAAGSFNYKCLLTETFIPLKNLIYYIMSIILVYMVKSNMWYVRDHWYTELRWITYISIVQSIMIWFMLGYCREYFIKWVSHISQGLKLFINEFLELGLVH